MLGGPTTYAVAWGELWLEYDTRDNELVTRTGVYHQLRVRASPGQPYPHGEANATLRLYRAPLPWLRLAGRLLGDVLVGHPPLHEFWEKPHQTLASSLMDAVVCGIASS